MPNERKQINRDAEKNRSTREHSTTNDASNDTPKRSLDWDARDLKESTWLRGSSGEYENRFFE